MLRFGPAEGPVVVAALPLFEEANRTRAFVVTILRALAERGIAGALPDLPGQGESLVPTEAARLADWRAAFAAAARSLGRRPHGFALRSSAVLDSEADLISRWRLSPISGQKAIGELQRAEVAGRKDKIKLEMFGPDSPPATFAGNRIAFPLFRDLLEDEHIPSVPGPLRTIRLATEAASADAKFEAAPLWRRAEPDNDLAFAERVADDIAQWIAACAA